jgi:hypothetical protein
MRVLHDVEIIVEIAKRVVTYLGINRDHDDHQHQAEQKCPLG